MSQIAAMVFQLRVVAGMPIGYSASFNGIRSWNFQFWQSYRDGDPSRVYQRRKWWYQ